MAHSEDRQPLLPKHTQPIVPPVLTQPGLERLNMPVSLPNEASFPPTGVTAARYDSRKRRFPQCIAHRGYKAKFPENTMGAFRGAVEVGAHAIETDLHITKDEVVVISHDATLKRCYGRKEKIIDCTWDEIKDLQTLAKPHQSMPRLSDVLEYLAQPGLEDIWLLLDIKLDNNVDDIMRLIASTIASVPAPAAKKWRERVVLGIWAARYLPLCLQYLPGFPVTHIGFSVAYARHFFTVPNVGFNMLLPMLIAPGGRKFIRDAKEDHRQVLAWTVNSKEKMEWCIRRDLDGVITDDPALFLDVCNNFDDKSQDRWLGVGLLGFLDVLRVWLFIEIVGRFYAKKLQPVASKELIMKARDA